MRQNDCDEMGLEGGSELQVTSSMLWKKEKKRKTNIKHSLVLKKYRIKSMESRNYEPRKLLAMPCMRELPCLIIDCQADFTDPIIFSSSYVDLLILPHPTTKSRLNKLGWLIRDLLSNEIFMISCHSFW